MAISDHPRRDARRCLRCGARGILPLNRPTGDNGQIQDPAMICRVCGDEFQAVGMKWLGADPAPNVADMTEDELAAWTDEFVDKILRDAD